jgi:hypothetical protein
MTPTTAPRHRVDGASLRHARLARVNMIRRRVISGAVALFVATWLLITLLLVTGHDPALASQTAASSSGAKTSTSSANSSGNGTSGATTSTSGVASTSTSTGSASTTSSPSTSSTSSSSGLSPVTSSQS